MRIGIDVRPLAYGMTGNSRYLAEVLELMLERNQNVSFVFFSNKPIHKMFLHLLKSNVTQEIERYPIPGPVYLNFRLPKRLEKHKITKFWGTLQMLPFFKLPIPSFVNYHDLNFVSAPQTMAKWNYYQHRFFSPRTMKNADGIFCLSENTKNEIAKFNPDFASKCKVIYPGVKKQNFEKESLFPKSFFLTVGTLEPRKNLKILLDAFLDFKFRFPKDKNTLVLMGRKGWGTEGDELYNSLNQLQKTNPFVRFLENPNDKILTSAFAQCKAFFFPSLHEGFGLPLLEAMIEDKRCVASDIPVFKEILSDKCDLYVNANDLSGWSKAFEVMAKAKPGRIPKFKTKSWTWLETTKKIEESLGL